MPIVPYTDGSRATRQRAVIFDTTNSNADVPYVRLHELCMNSDRVRVYNDVVSASGVATVAANLATLTIDTRGMNRCFIRLGNTGATAWTDCQIDCSTVFNSNLWETFVNADTFYTTGQGETLNNSMILVRKVRASFSPRTLAAAATTWLILNTEGIPQIRFRITTTNTGNTVAWQYTLSHT